MKLSQIPSALDKVHRSNQQTNKNINHEQNLVVLYPFVKLFSLQAIRQ